MRAAKDRLIAASARLLPCHGDRPRPVVTPLGFKSSAKAVRSGRWASSIAPVCALGVSRGLRRSKTIAIRCSQDHVFKHDSSAQVGDFGRLEPRTGLASISPPWRKTVQRPHPPQRHILLLVVVVSNSFPRAGQIPCRLQTRDQRGPR